MQTLDPRYVFLIDAGLQIFVWYGMKCKNVLKSKARLMAEKINKIERKNKATIQIFTQGEEPLNFWQALADEDEEGAEEDIVPTKGPEMHVSSDFVAIVPR